MAKKKIFIMLTGLPASGKTTARKLLSQYLYHIYGIKSQIINKDEIRLDIQATNTKMNMDEINAAAKRSSMSMLSCWKSDPKFPVCIWDNISQDVFSRMPILDELKTNEDDILICALHMNRDLQFCRKHNNDPDRNPVPDKVVNIWGRRYQQPIYDAIVKMDFEILMKRIPESHRSIITMRLQGCTQKEIANHYDCSGTHIGNLLRKYMNLNNKMGEV